MKQFLAQTNSLVYRDRYLYLIVALLCVASFTINEFLETGARINYLLYFSTIARATFLLFSFLLAGFLTRLLLSRHPSPVSGLAGKIKDILNQPAEIASFLLLTLAIIIFKSAFTAQKAMIPALLPFSQDRQYALWDQWLHFGYAPWEITHGLFDHPLMTLFISHSYSIWFILYWVILMYFTVIKGNEKLRQQYLVSFFLCWAVVGNVFATLMSSGGPCFYKYLVPDEDVYSGLFARLHEQNYWIITNIGGAEIWALKLQEMLWNHYTEDVTGLGSGISAMPSMHVSVAVLMALGTGALNKYLGYVFWLYAVIIQIGSVHLGWHYAVDGYIGGILTFIIWKMVGMIIATSTDDSAVIRSPQPD